jgi:hypothetical protein
MIYLFLTDIGIDAHTIKEYGKGEFLAEITEREWEQYDHIARMIDGKLFLGKTQTEKDEEQAREVRAKRDRLIAQEDWRYARYASEIRQGLPPSDDIKTLDAYVQALRDISAQKGFPWDVEWPEGVYGGRK